MTGTTTVPTAPSRRLATARALRSVVVAAVVVLVVVLVWPARWGGHLSLTIVHGHSMDPTYATGDVLVGWRGPVEPGDVIVYEVPEAGGHVVHRVVGSDEDGWITQGDGNDWTDPFRPTDDDVLGVVHVRIPGLGSLGGLGMVLASPVTWLALLVIGAGVLLYPGRDDELPDDASDDDRGAP